jgi:hypothetical protein
VIDAAEPGPETSVDILLWRLTPRDPFCPARTPESSGAQISHGFDADRAGRALKTAAIERLGPAPIQL